MDDNSSLGDILKKGVRHRQGQIVYMIQADIQIEKEIDR